MKAERFECQQMEYTQAVKVYSKVCTFALHSSNSMHSQMSSHTQTPSPCPLRKPSWTCPPVTLPVDALVTKLSLVSSTFFAEANHMNFNAWGMVEVGTG